MKKTLIAIAALTLAVGCTNRKKVIEYTSETERSFFNISEMSSKDNSMKDLFGANIVFDTYDDDKGMLEFDGEVRKIGNSAFANCAPLESIIIPDGVKYIERYAFFNCRNLEEVVIPKNVLQIGFGAFLSCRELEEVYCHAVNPPAIVTDESGNWDAFEGSDDKLKIHVPKKSLNAYLEAEGWKKYASRIVAF